MCNFLSAIVFQSGRVHADPEHTDSHEDMIAALDLKDDREFARDWIRVEFTPKDGDYFDIDSYELKVDEATTPVWFDEDRRAATENDLRSRVRQMIVTTDRKIILGGCWLIPENINIDVVKSGRVVWCGGTVNGICGGTVNVIRGGTVNEIRGGTVNAIWGGTVNEIWGGTVNEIWGGTVNAIWGGTVNEIWGGTVKKDHRTPPAPAGQEVD